jgi:hypothetical protein
MKQQGGGKVRTIKQYYRNASIYGDDTEIGNERWVQPYWIKEFLDRDEKKLFYPSNENLKLRDIDSF